LDATLQPVPIGVSGELYIGGHGLARGYLERPDLTAEKFLPDPFSEEPGARLYWTGDFARYLPDGNIEFLGRMDHQVKIRGFRVELAEIETALEQHPTVRKAVVLKREDVPGDEQLVAYIVPSHSRVTASVELARFLKHHLPGYMVPSGFVVLEALPLTPNGKVDRRALPAPDTSKPDLSLFFVGPRNSVEEVLAAIWAEVLKLERVDVHDDFFALGGHSLLALRVVSRIRNAFDVNIPLRTLFDLPTVASLAAAITQAQSKPVFTKEMAGVVTDVESLPDEGAGHGVGPDHRKNV
jgi:acyl carrier protein